MLIGLAQRGDTGARSALARSLGPRLTSMARYYARTCDEEYDDLLGEAWSAVFEALAITDVTIGHPEQFLLKRARWRILDYVKWARRRRSNGQDESDEEACSADIAHEVIGTTWVSQLSNDLNDTQRVVLGRLMAGDTWREVARRLGCSSANVAYHVRQIRQRCARHLEEEEAAGLAGSGSGHRTCAGPSS